MYPLSFYSLIKRLKAQLVFSLAEYISFNKLLKHSDVIELLCVHLILFSKDPSQRKRNKKHIYDPMELIQLALKIFSKISRIDKETLRNYSYV